MAQVRTVTPNGQRIRELRLGLAISADDLAKRTGPNRHGQTIRKIERGAILAVSELLLAQIAKALGVPPREITLAAHGEAGERTRSECAA